MSLKSISDCIPVNLQVVQVIHPRGFLSELFPRAACQDFRSPKLGHVQKGWQTFNLEDARGKLPTYEMNRKSVINVLDGPLALT